MNRLNIIILVLAVLLTSCQNEANPITKVLNENPELKAIAMEGSGYEVQILFTRIGADEMGFHTFQSFSYNLDPNKYFYPASTVKLPVAILALEKINDLNLKDLNQQTAMLVDSVRPPQSNAHIDTSTLNQLPTIERYIEKIFIASDNDAYNRLYEFLGQEYINERLQNIGAFTNSKIVHRLESSNYSIEDNRHTNRVRFVNAERTIYIQDPQYCAKDFETTKLGLIRGEGYKKDGVLINEPFDFTHKNAITIRDLEGILMRVMYPESFPESQRFNLTRDNYNFLLNTMSRLPRNSGIEAYRDTSYYFDSYVKFFMFGDSKKKIPEHFKIYNKVGQAYGFLIDCAYIQDHENDLEFFLTACLHVNENEIFNDNDYQYDEIGFPFLAELGRKIYEHELLLKTKS